MRLNELFQIYLLKREVWDNDDILTDLELSKSSGGKQEPVEIPQKVLELINQPTKEFPIEETPREGDVIEIVPSVDGLPLLFVVWDIDDELGDIRLVPLSEFYQFATDKDLLIELKPVKGLPRDENIHGKVYMAQPTLYITVPQEKFAYWFGNRAVYKVGEVPKEVLKNLDLIYGGEIKGSGNMEGGIKEAFKKEEAKRYALLQQEIWANEIETIEINEALRQLMKELPVAKAADQMPYSGMGDGFLWEYDKKLQILFLIPMNKDLIGRTVRLVLELPDGKRIVLWEGILWDGRIPVIIDEENFRGDIFQRFLKLETEN
jgi:hypothetical protein